MKRHVEGILWGTVVALPYIAALCDFGHHAFMAIAVVWLATTAVVIPLHFYRAWKRAPRVQNRREYAAWVGFETLAVAALIALGIYSTLGTHAQQKGPRDSGASLRTINSACELYARTYREHGYPRRLGQLGPTDSGNSEGPEHAGFISSVLASGSKSGYAYTYTPGPLDQGGRTTTYSVTARPQVFGKTGRRSYYTDQTGVIRFTNENRTPVASDPVLD